MTRLQVWIAVNAAFVLVVAVGFASYVWRTNVHHERQGRIDNCIAINELSRKVYVTMRDLGYSEFEVRKFKPTLHCEDVP